MCLLCSAIKLRLVVDHLLSLCFSGGNSYRKERKNRTNPKPAEIEQAENPVVEEPMVNNIGPVMIPSSTIKVPERKLPAFDIPQILKHQIGYNCHLVHDKDAVRNNIIILY